MAKFKMYSINGLLRPICERLSRVIHGCMMEALQFPADQCVHRFFWMAKEDFFYPEGRTSAYIIIKMGLISGRSVAAKKKPIRPLFENIQGKLGIAHRDIEICIQESPAKIPGLRGMRGDGNRRNYKIGI